MRPTVQDAGRPYLAGFTTDGLLQIRFEKEEISSSRML
jgi:hypothetical protein